MTGPLIKVRLLLVCMERRLKKIIKKCLKNDRKAQFDLYQASFDHLMGICCRYKRNREDAVSLLNDGFLKILLHLKAYDFNKEFMPWISTIMVRVAIDDYRKNKSYYTETDFKGSDYELEKVTNNNDYFENLDKLSVKEIEELIFGLPDNERIVFTLYEIEGFMHEEIANELNVSVRTTKRYLRKAKQDLQDKIRNKKDLKKVI